MLKINKPCMDNGVRAIIPIILTFDNNFVRPAKVSIYSLLKNANKSKYYQIHILQSDITEDNKDLLRSVVDLFKNSDVEFIDMRHKFNEIYKMDHNVYTKEILYKLLISSLFPQYDKVVITDMDVIYCGNFSTSYDIDLGNNYFAGVAPVGRILYYYYSNLYSNFSDDEIKKLSTIGAGFLIANLKKIRKDNFEEVMINYLYKNFPKLVQPEQDVINYCCFGKILKLALKYMVCTYTYDLYKTDDDMRNDSVYSYQELKDSMNNPIHLHYAGGVNKPWKNKCSMDNVWYMYENEVNEMIYTKPMMI